MGIGNGEVELGARDRMGRSVSDLLGVIDRV